MIKVYEIITERITQELKKGVVPWRKPWRSTLPQNLISRKEYRGINWILLNSLPFESPYFLTFKQARALGGFVRRGEKGIPIVFWNFIIDEESESKKKLPFLRYYTVFNVSQCEGIQIPTVPQRQFNEIEECERIVCDMPHAPTIEHGATHASYSPRTDTVKMPARETFDTPQHFYSTLFHELCHSTGSLLRLNRQGITEDVAFGSQTYSKEELIAELGCSFLCAKAGIVGTTIQNSASYIAGWLAALKNDKRLVISAAGQGQKAADYILNVETSREAQ
jgi:antirestriction protein ArdC